MRYVKLALAGLAVILGIGALVWAFLPQPVPVDLYAVQPSPMAVTVSAEGITRVRDPRTVTAPLAGTVARSPVQVGDAVTTDTVVAEIRPAEPAFLDARARAQAEAAVVEAEAAVRLAEVNLTRAEADLAYAEGQLARNRALAARGTIPQRAMEDSQQQALTAARALDAARYDLDLHRATLDRMRAQLQLPSAGGAPNVDCCLQLTAPLPGTVLAITDTGARLVQAGEPLVTVGDLSALKIETDILSADAVNVRPGALAHVERWGGAGVLTAHVTRVDPAGFTRVSALGIEEQRVRVHLDIDSPAEARPGLGDQYRVFVRIVIWSDDDVLQVPQSALFRQDGGWAVWRAVDARAVLTPVSVGHTQGQLAAITDGLNAGDLVVAYPGASVAQGVRLLPLSD
jgi:HlyD family secretion protein